jgi:hypothetical protein
MLPIPQEKCWEKVIGIESEDAQIVLSPVIKPLTSRIQWVFFFLVVCPYLIMCFHHLHFTFAVILKVRHIGCGFLKCLGF